MIQKIVNSEKIFSFMVDVKDRLLKIVPDAEVFFEPQDAHSLYILVRWPKGKISMIVSISEIRYAKFDCAGEWVDRIKNRIGQS